MSPVIPSVSLTLSAAQAMVAAAIAEAEALKVAQVVAILDASGRLKTMGRMDGAPVVSIEVAQDKAYTALLGLPSGELFAAIERDASLRASMPSIPRITMIAGGFPIRVDGQLVGAIGVGGGTTEQDAACARAGLRALDDLQ